MAEKKTLKRTFESELRSLPIELVPPDPNGLNQTHKHQSASQFEIHPLDIETERGLVGKLIDRIKKL
jgi:hypothetical protein